MTNPIDDIENRQGNRDLGRLVTQVYLGAKSEASFIDAFWATVAYVVAMIKAGQDQSDETAP